VRKKILIGFLLFFALVWVWNSSLFASTENNQTRLLAHRGVHQTFSQENLENDTCTAEHIYPVTHGFIENTIPSMRAAFAAGADVVELDVHLTADKQFAVYHDWRVDCRTNGTGVTEELDMAYLKSLDVGYGYTADQGETYPLRRTGIGLMPTLREVFETFPEGRFLINFKSGRAEEGEALAVLLNANPEWRDLVFGVYGGEVPTRRALELVGDLKGYDQNSVFSCLGQYMGMGWTGMVPGACENQLLVVPGNLGWALWGWPNRFTQRMAEAGSMVIVLGPYSGGGFSSGIDREEHVALVPENFDGYVWTSRIEVMGKSLVQQ